MNASINCLFERVSNLSVAIVLAVIGLGFIVVGITVLPVLGLFIAGPILAASAGFAIAHRSKACRMS